MSAVMRRSRANSKKKQPLDIINESDDESALFGKSSDATKVPQMQTGQFGIHLHETQALQACNFSDLSSIVAYPLQEGEFEGDQNNQQIKLEAPTGADCMRSIPISVMILRELADAVIDEDVRKEKASRKRALRLAISQSWTTAFNNQFFNDKRKFESMTDAMKIDIQEAEVEPVPCPIDNYCSRLPGSKVKIRVKEPKMVPRKIQRKASSQKPWFINVSPLQRKSTRLVTNTSLQLQHQRSTTDRQRKKEIYNARRFSSTLANMQLMPEFQLLRKQKNTSKIGSLLLGQSDAASEMVSETLSAGSSPTNNRRRFLKSTTVQRPEAVLLNDYYSDYENRSSVENTISQDEMSSLLLQKKKTVRAKKGKEKDIFKLGSIDIYGQVESRERLGMTKLTVQQLNRQPLSEVAFDSQAQIIQKHSAAKISADIAVHEARLKKNEIVFKVNGPTFIDSNAPGFSVSKSQNKKLKRIQTKPDSPSPPVKAVGFAKQSHSRDQKSMDTAVLSEHTRGGHNQSQTLHSISQIKDKSRIEKSRIVDQSTMSQIEDSQMLQDAMQAADKASKNPPKEPLSPTNQKEKDEVIVPTKLSQALKQYFVQKINELHEQEKQEKVEKEQEKPEKPKSIMSQLFKDAILRKIMDAEKKSSSRGHLMPRKFTTHYRTQQTPSMVGYIKPYNIKYKKGKPRFKIDQKTLSLYQTDELRESLGKDDVKRLSMERAASEMNQFHKHTKSEEGLLFGHLIQEANKGTQAMPRSSTQKRPNLTAKGNTRNGKDLGKLQSWDDYSKPLWHQQRRKQVQIENVDHLDSQDSVYQRKAVKSRDLKVKNRLSIIPQGNDDSENVSPFANTTRFKPGNHVTLPPISLAKSSMSKTGSHKNFSRIRVNNRSQVAQLSELDKNNCLIMSQPQSLTSLLQVQNDQNAIMTPTSYKTRNFEKSTKKQFISQVKSQAIFNKNESTNFTTQVATSAPYELATLSAMTSQRIPPNATKANLIKAIEKPKLSFTSKIQIKNFELAQKVQSGRNHGDTNRATHGLLNIDSGLKSQRVASRFSQPSLY